MRLWREEVFGPVLASATFCTEEEAIAIANGSQYGLAAAVISADAERCKRVAAAMETGIVWINCSQPCFCQVSIFPLDDHVLIHHLIDAPVTWHINIRD